MHVVYLQPLNALSSEEEHRLQEIISKLKEEVKKRRLLVYPFCRDYDRVGVGMAWVWVWGGCGCMLCIEYGGCGVGVGIGGGEWVLGMVWVEGWRSVLCVRNMMCVLYIRTYVCMFVRTYVCTYVCTYVKEQFPQIYVFSSILGLAQAYTYVQQPSPSHVFTYVRTYIRIPVYGTFRDNFNNFG